MIRTPLRRASRLRRTAPVRKRKKTRKGLKIRVDALDTLWAKVVKLRGGGTCRRCGTRPAPRGLHAHHIVPRRYHGTRWDPDNGLAMCYGCHRWAHEHVMEFVAWVDAVVGQIGGRYGTPWLWAKARAAAKIDRAAVKAFLQETTERIWMWEMKRVPGPSANERS